MARSRPLFLAAAACVLLAGARGGAEDPSPVDLRGLDEVNAALREFQRGLIAAREQVTPELRRILARKVVVPPPGQTVEKPETLADAWTAIVPPELRASVAVIGEVALGDEEGAHATISLRRGLTVSTADDALVFDRDATFEAAFGGVAAEASEGGDVKAKLVVGAYTYSETKSGEGDLETRLGTGWLGLSWSGEAVGLRAGEGLALEPSRFLRAKLGLEEALKLERVAETARGIGHAVKVTGRCAWATSKRARRAVTAALRAALTCPYCQGNGGFTCPRCQDARSVTCPTCSGGREAPCSSCGASGQRSCSTTESCGSCSGRGTTRCGSCGGRGKVTGSETYTEWKNVLLPGGFDGAGNPVYRNEYQPFTRTRSVDETCSSCGGSGSGGACGACGGSGRTTCSRCGGSGSVTCGACGGTGKVPCRTCSGSGSVVCPFCGGDRLLCPLCQGAGSIAPEERGR